MRHCSELIQIGLLMATEIVFSTGCAKIADPQPPVIRVLKPAVDLAAFQHSDSVVLTVTIPGQNTDGSAATTVGSLEVYRLAEDTTKNIDSGPLPEEQFEKRATQILSIPAARFPSYLREKSLVIEDKLLLPKGSSLYSSAFRYAVLFLNTRNQTAGFSNQVLIAPLAIPLPPRGITAEVTESFIKLKWIAPSENMDDSKPVRIAWYKIYRSEESAQIPPAPIGTTPGQESSFEDKDFQFDKTYYYAVSVVGSSQNPYAESQLSESFAVTPRDVFRPIPPKDFNAILQGGIVILLWTPSTSPDVAGYRIYRREEGMTEGQPLQSELIDSLSFRDAGVKPGRNYEYSILAVDGHGNASDAVRAELEAQ